MLKIGGKFGDYTVEALLGQGGMGEVYLIRGAGGGAFAVKVMTPPEGDEEHEFRRRFAREAEIAMKVEHRNLIKVYDVGEDPETGLCYIIMDYVPGGSVAQKLKAQRRLSIEEALTVTVKIAAALGKAHKAGVVHRDIKPDNIMFDADGTPKLADLGIAKFEDGREATQLTSTGMVIGTPAYMAPEQMLDSHNVTPKADIYSLGMVLYEMLTGERPHGNSSLVEMMSKALKGEELRDVRELRPEVPDELAKVLKKMCARNPEERPADTQEVMKLLNEAAEKMRTRRGGPGAKVRLALRRMRFKKSTKRIVRVVLGLLVAAAMVGVGIVAGSLDNMVEGADEIDRFADLPIDRLDLDNGENLVIEAEEKAMEEVPVEQVEEVQTEEMPVVVEEAAPVEEAAAEEVKFRYEVEGDGVAIAGIEGEARPEKLVIPDMIDGKRVVRIKEKAFANCQWLRQVQVPEGVNALGYRAFAECGNLELVLLPESVEVFDGEAFKDCSKLVWVKMPAQMSKLGYGSFAGCRELQRLHLPEGIAHIEVWLCSECRELKNITIPESAKSIDQNAFDGCTNLRKVEIGKGTEVIRDNAFNGCISLDSITIPDSVEVISESAFTNVTRPDCKINASEEIQERFKAGLARLQREKYTYNLQLKHMNGQYTLTGHTGRMERGTHLRIPGKVTKIGDGAFYNCKEIGSVQIPENVKEIGVSAFCNCTGLTRVTLPKGLSFIDDGAFRNSDLQEVLIPGSVKVIKSATFANCRNLAKVELEDGVQRIEKYAFVYCDSLKEITIPDSVTYIDSSAFAHSGVQRNCKINASEAVKKRFWRQEGNELTESENVKAQVRRGYCIVTKPNVRYAAGTYLRIPKEIDGYAVREIEKWAFVDSHELVGVEIPDGVVEIGSGAFYCCTGLKGVIIPGSVKEIRKSTFAKCTGLEIVTVKKGIERIEAYAFSECRNLKSVILPDTITYIDDLAFGTGLSADCTIYASPATIKRLKLKNRSWSLQAKVQPSK